MVLKYLLLCKALTWESGSAYTENYLCSIVMHVATHTSLIIGKDILHNDVNLNRFLECMGIAVSMYMLWLPYQHRH